MEMTLFELHLDDASFAANAPFSGSDEGSGGIFGGGESEMAAESEDSGGRSPVAFVVGLVFLVGIGLAVRRMMRGRGDSGTGETEPTADPITA